MGKYKHGKQLREMTKEEFYQHVESGNFVKFSHKVFLILLYYVGCRVTEALRLTRDKFKVTKSIVYAEIKAEKGGIQRPAFELNRSLPYVELLVKRVEAVQDNKLVFPFNRVTGWLIVKRACGENFYPHFFRLNRTVKFLNNPQVTLDEIRQWMAWKSIDTVNNYLGYSERTIGKLSQEIS